MRLKLLLLSLLICNFTLAQQSLTSEQINRLADAGKIYGYVKYFHPWVQYKDFNWDSAFLSNVEKIIKAKDKNEYAAVIQKLLSTLNDNMTSVVTRSIKNNIEHLPPTSYNTTDGILYINFDEFYSNDSILQEAYANPEKLKGVIYDMRKPANPQLPNNPVGSLLDGAIVWNGSPVFFKGDALIPSLRKLYHKGVYETGFNHGSSFKITGIPKKNIPLVFIIKDEDEIPLAAIGLQQKGVAAIIQQDGKELLPGRSINFYITDSIIIKMRVAEAVNGDGSLSVVHPNAFYAASENTDSVIQMGKNIIVNGIKNPSYTSVPAPPVLWQSGQQSHEDYFPTKAYRMLAAAKIYAAVDYLFPCKDLMDKDWEKSYRSTISKFIEASDSLDYLRAVAELYSNINDSHGFITYGPFSLKLNPIIQGRGNYVPPVITSVIENKVIVTGIYDDSVCRKAGIEKGDIILSIDGKDPMKLINENRKYQPASTIANQTFLISKFLLFGNKGQVRILKIQNKNGNIRETYLPTIKEFDGNWWNDDYTLAIYSQHTNPTFKLLTKDIGYVDLTSPLTNKDADSMFALFKNTKGIIFDDRGYPHSNADLLGKMFVKHPDAVISKGTISVAVFPNVEEIGGYEEKPKEIYTSEQSDFRNLDINNSGSKWIYPGKIVMLINEAPQSSGDALPMTWKTACDAILIGSPTSGTSAEMAWFTIPGNLTLYYSQYIGAFPDGKRIQRVGVQPDILVTPTIKGIQAGKDEVLDRAIKYLQTEK